MRPLRIAVTATLLGMLGASVPHATAEASPPVIAASSSPTEASPPLIEGSTTTAVVPVPYPGHTETFEVEVRPSTDAGEIVLSVADSGGPLADGKHALRLTLSDDEGAVVARGTAAELSDEPIRLGARSGPLSLHGTAALPAEAGDAYQNTGLTLSLTIGAYGAAEEPFPPAELAVTGAELAAAIAVALLAITVALLLLALRQKRRKESN